MHYREITRKMLDGAWSTSGKTPWATVNARISTEIKKLGSESRFVRVGPGTYSLASQQTTRPTGNGASSSRTAQLTFADAAARVLRERHGNSPMHYKAITERALASGLINTQSKTPEATMNSAIWAEIRRSGTRGERPRFHHRGRGLFGLSEQTPSGIADRINQINLEVTAALLERARSADPSAFELLVAELLAALGFEGVEVTKAAGDGGIDVRGTLVVAGSVRIRMAVQAKRWKGNVPAPVVQQVRGSLGAHEQGLIITTSDFSSGAAKEATRSDAAPVALMNGAQFSRLLAQHEIGVRIDRHELFVIETELAEVNDPNSPQTELNF